MIRLLTIIAIFAFWLSFPSTLDAHTNDICLLDMRQRNAGEVEEDGDNDYAGMFYSAEYLCQIAGYPYVVADNPEQAMRSRVIVLSSGIMKTSFTSDELDSLIEWVENGGVLLTPAIRQVPRDCGPQISRLFGIDSSNITPASKTRPLIQWSEEHSGEPELVYFDDPREIETSIGQVRSYAVPAADAEVLATFPADNTAAVTRHRLGDGTTYVAGILWRDVVLRNQLNKDLHASRDYNNFFEPSADIWSFFLRSIYAKTAGVSAWMFTVPGGYSQVLVPTHDCDSKTAYQKIRVMGDYEKSVGLKSHFFATTHYYSDEANFGHKYLSAFYDAEGIDSLRLLTADGHTVGSHSIGHFPDFNKYEKSLSNTDIVSKEEYAHRATCEEIDGKKTSRGVSTWAEIVLSKQILEEDLGNSVRSFRSGHLCVNADFNDMMEAGGIEFASCYTAGDLLSEFPFFGRIGNKWGGRQSTVLQMPLHISDVFGSNIPEGGINNDNWESHNAVNYWENVMSKLRANYASGIILIHPNRDWKMELEKRLVGRLDPEETGLCNFEKYGDFWKARFSTGFSYAYDDISRSLTITTDIDAVKRNEIAFCIDAPGQEISFDNISVRVCDAGSGESLPCSTRQLSDSRILVFPERVSGIERVSIPSDGQNINFSLDPRSKMLQIEENGLYNICNLAGTNIMSFKSSEDNRLIDLSSLPRSVYFIVNLTTSKSARFIL